MLLRQDMTDGLTERDITDWCDWNDNARNMEGEACSYALALLVKFDICIVEVLCWYAIQQDTRTDLQSYTCYR